MDTNKLEEYDVKFQRTKELGIKAGQIIEEYSNKIKTEKREALSYFREIRSTVEKKSEVLM